MSDEHKSGGSVESKALALARTELADWIRATGCATPDEFRRRMVSTGLIGESMKKKQPPPSHITETITIPMGLSINADVRAKQLGLSLSEFALYAAIRYMDDRTPMDWQQSAAGHSEEGGP